MAVKWIDASEISYSGSSQAESAVLTASWLLYKLTAEKYPGVRTSTEWYGVDSNQFSLKDYGALQSLVNISMFEIDDHQLKYLRLRKQPVQSITSLTLGNASLDPDNYILVNHSSVARVDGQFWDLGQGIVVEYVHGIQPPEAGKRAARRLADEIVLSFEDPENCQLPERAKSFNRQGISYTMLDPQEYFDKGRTGISEVDLFIITANPKRARKRPRVFSTEIPRGRKTN